MTERDSEIQNIKEKMNNVEDDVFSNFCGQIGVTNIRQYEERELRSQQERGKKRMEFENKYNRIQNQLDFEKQRDTESARKILSFIFPTSTEGETFSGGHLVASYRSHRRYSSDDGVNITASPSKWPGVTSLRALLSREKDEDTPKLNILLCEAFVSTFMSLFVYALSCCVSHILYRLVGHHFDNNTWSTLFGGGVKKLIRVASSSSQVSF